MFVHTLLVSLLCSRCSPTEAQNRSQLLKKMSVNIYPVTRPEENNSGSQGTSVGGDKPLHRFLKGQPKIIGVVMIVLGLSLLVTSVTVEGTTRYFEHLMWLPYMLGGLYVLSGILFILTEHNPTKKTVTFSLALSVVTTLTITWWSFLTLSGIEGAPLFFIQHEIHDYDIAGDHVPFSATSEAMLLRIYTIQKVLNFVGAIIFIVMSILAGRALKSTKSKMVVVMTAAPTETSSES